MKVLKRLSRIAAAAAIMLASCNGHDDKPTESTPKVSDKVSDTQAPSLITWDIVKVYPHEPTAFTEGLEFRDGVLYESTGEYGKSDVRKVDLTTGKVITSTKMEARYFGEGLTILNNKIYQLTYREGKGFIYNPATLRQEGTFNFQAPEGWGMTSNGSQLIFDDGTNVLHFIDPTTFKETRRLSVTDERGPVNEINELELIKGYFYANVWQKDVILKIDTATGHVVARADLSTLRERGGLPPFTGKRGEPEVLNGIAFAPTGNRVFITGKNWPKLFEIKLDN